MKRYLKNYQVTLRTVGPLFVGNGKEIGKKEYVFLNRKEVGIPDIYALYREMGKRKKVREFEAFLLGNGRDDLTAWLRKQKIGPENLKFLMRYTLDCGDASFEKGARLQILECIKDAYGCPYVPGSSLKGMFRTILLGHDIAGRPRKYQNVAAELRKNADRKASRTLYLKRDIANVESIAFRTLARETTRPGDAVNDVMQGFGVSDSEPLPVESLVLCQRVELHTDGEERTLPILRECIRPDTEIRFSITVDTRLCPFDETLLMEAVRSFMEGYCRDFLAAFAGAERPRENDVLLGGGSGFVSKTVVYPMYGRKTGIEVTRNIFEKTNVPRMHKHEKDPMYGASPHILKCTRYRGQTVQMGVCRMEEIKEAR